jgi:hypothetical protein
MPRYATGTALLAAMALIASGCSDAGNSPTTDPQVNFNLATRSSAAAPAAAAPSFVVATPESFTDGANTLVLDQVELVLREIELKKSDATTSCSESQGNDSCEELEFGPVLLSLPLGTAGAERVFSVTVAPGTYSEVEFEIHPPSGSEDAAFLQANPALAGVSVHVTGTYNGAPFDFVSNLEAEQEVHLATPLVVTETAATDLTLFIDLDGWFRDAGGALVDPATAAAGQSNESLIKENIKRAFEAFEDGDHDGADDHGNDQGGDNNGGNGGVDDGPNHM